MDYLRLVTLLMLLALLAAGAARAAEPGASAADDRFLAGAASALLEMRFGLSEVELEVVDRHLVLDPSQLGGHDPRLVRAALQGYRGLRVTLRDEASAGAQHRGVQAADPQPPIDPQPSAATEPPADPVIREVELRTGFLPEIELWEPLIADPRAPVISASYQRYLGEDDLANVGSPNFAGTLPIYGWEAAGGLWQIGAQGGVFSIFDLDSSSTDLVNSDFLAALPLEARYGRLGARLRLFHQSSHLGDEFLLRSQVDRDNLSYEGVDLLLSYDLAEWIRAYGGGSMLLRRSPSELDRFGAQAGVELRGPRPIIGSMVFPIAGLDVQSQQETDWNLDLSLKAGVELRNGLLAGKRIQLLAEYFNGRSPNGQFFPSSIEYWGFGFRVLF